LIPNRNLHAKVRNNSTTDFDGKNKEQKEGWGGAKV